MVNSRTQNINSQWQMPKSTADVRVIRTNLSVSKSQTMRNVSLRTIGICLGLLCLGQQASAQNVGIGTQAPDRLLELEGFGDRYLRIHTTSIGSSIAGLELIRGGEFSATDWQIINDGGDLQFLDGTNNFVTPGQLNLTITPGGNVGIGTDNPASHVHISGNTDQFLTIQKTVSGSGLVGLDLLRANEFSATDWRIVNDGGELQFLDATDNFNSPGDLNMTITQGGNVGIGLESPEAHLHVYGGVMNGTSGGTMLRVGNSTGDFLAFDNNEIAARNGSGLPDLLYLQYWGGNISLCADDDGEVGIGTTNPQAKLHITDGGDADFSGGGQLVLGPTSGANLALDGNEILARNNGAEAPLFLQISGGDVLMTPNENGQVGIGVTSMANMPTDDYLLAVDGKIISEEVRVEMSGSWPDYVFAPDYHLTPLSELETEIQTHGHLPGIPSAQTVESEGFELGDMQRRMMEKIEELTLYMIQADKEIQALKKSNIQLQEQLKALHHE